jgi:hypothetical protein
VLQWIGRIAEFNRAGRLAAFLALIPVPLDVLSAFAVPIPNWLNLMAIIRLFEKAFGELSEKLV